MFFRFSNQIFFGCFFQSVVFCVFSNQIFFGFLMLNIIIFFPIGYFSIRFFPLFFKSDFFLCFFFQTMKPDIFLYILSKRLFWAFSRLDVFVWYKMRVSVGRGEEGVGECPTFTVYLVTCFVVSFASSSRLELAAVMRGNVTMVTQ